MWRVILVCVVAVLFGRLVPAYAEQDPEGARAPQWISIAADQPNAIEFAAQPARFVRVVLRQSQQGQACIDELEIFARDDSRNLALAAEGSRASASSCLPGYSIHQVGHLNDGRYGNDHSWIAQTEQTEWVQIELPRTADVSRVVFSRDRQGVFRDRLPVSLEVWLSTDGQTWSTVCRARDERTWMDHFLATTLADARSFEDLVRYAFLCEQRTWGRIDRDQPVKRVLDQMGDLLRRSETRGLDVTVEKRQWQELRKLQLQVGADPAAQTELYLSARAAKRKLFLRDPDLARLERIVFVKRQPYEPSHNYSDILDSKFDPGGGVYLLELARRGGRLQPDEGKLTTLFDASDGIARDAMADFDAATVYFAYRPAESQAGDGNCYWHLMSVRADGSQLRQLTEGPFHDYYPCPLPDGGLSFISTRCRARFLCWRPQAFVLFRMDPDGGSGSIQPLSFANLSEWAPSVMRDGRILWTRSEYLDKGADFGHTLWAIRPDGSHPELVFGNNTRNCYMNGREVPGTNELCCTLISHGGDLNGPIGLIDLSRGPFDSSAITNITPDVAPHYHMSWPRTECFRDPIPITRDLFLVSHAPLDKFGLYVIDRWGNRELLYLDPAMGSMCPTPLRPVERPPITAAEEHADAMEGMGQLAVLDVYQGLEPAVERGTVKYLRVCQEVRSELTRLASGGFRSDHEPFQDFYATPTHLVSGPNGWPTYVAKADLGIVPVEEDGSANFWAPAGKVLYFQLLDQNFNEIQRMRSVMQLQPGERRTCIGCHEDRGTAPPARVARALGHEPRPLQPPPWGAKPLSFLEVVQPVWDVQCVACHDAQDAQQINLTGDLDADGVPASYRTLISQGWVHYFDCAWAQEHAKAQPMSFGSLQSPLWTILDRGHYDVQLSAEQIRRVKTWIDLNCPLWSDYQFRPERFGR
jgi:hypothetical protein